MPGSHEGRSHLRQHLIALSNLLPEIGWTAHPKMIHSMSHRNSAVLVALAHSPDPAGLVVPVVADHPADLADRFWADCSGPAAPSAFATAPLHGAAFLA